MTQLATQRIIDIEPKMVLEIAYGIENPEIIAERYGFSGSEWSLLKEYVPFAKQVEEKKVELKSTGITFKMKSAIAAEDIMTDVYLKAKDGGSSFHTQLESLKFFAKAAGFEAPAKEDLIRGEVFSITINLGGGKTVHVGAARVQENIVNVAVESSTYDAEMGEIPEHLRAGVGLMGDVG